MLEAAKQNQLFRSLSVMINQKDTVNKESMYHASHLHICFLDSLCWHVPCLLAIRRVTIAEMATAETRAANITGINMPGLFLLLPDSITTVMMGKGTR